MASKQSHVGFNEDFNLDALIHSALEKVQKRYRSGNLIENDDFEAIIRERLPEDTGDQMSNLISSQEKFRFRATSTDITTESLGGWLVEFQTINDVYLKLKTTKKPTKGFLIQNYYRCSHHNTRNWSPSKDPHRKLRTNPTARVKNTNCPFQMVIKINTDKLCIIDIGSIITQFQL